MKCLVLDLETSISSPVFQGDSKDPINDFYTIIYGDHPDRVRILHKENGFNRSLPDEFIQMLSNSDVVIAHNSLFDLGYLWDNQAFRNFLLRGGCVYDTMHAEYLLSGQRHKYASLEELQEIYLGVKTKISRISHLFKRGIGADCIVKARNRCRRLFALYEKYSLDDGVSTLKIFSKQYKKAKETGMLNVVKAHQRGLLGILMMQKSGMHIDIINCEKTLQKYRIEAMQHLKKAEAMIAPLWDERLGPFNINSPKQKSAILFGGEFKIKERERNGFFKNGNEKWKIVEKSIFIKGFDLSKEFTNKSKVIGRYQTGDAVIHKIAKYSKNEQAKNYCQLQKLAMNKMKMASTYLEPFLKFSIEGVLYPNYNIAQTVTSRLSSSKPNFQNVPSSGDNLIPIQGQLIAPKDWICISIDFGQLEPHVTAFLSRDVNLTNDLLSKVCLHCRALSWVPRLSEGKTYDEIYQLAQIKEDPVWKLKRKKAKGINFKRAYGGGAKGLAEEEGIPLEDVQVLFDAQDLEYYGVKAFNDKVFEEVQKTQQLSLKRHFGRRTRAGREFEQGIELLPIYDSQGNKSFRSGEYRHFGTFRCITGKSYSFEEIGRIDKYRNVRRSYSSTETKNYQIQGTAADVVAFAMAECFDYCLKHYDTAKMVRQIHDEIGFLCHKDYINQHISKIVSIMENVPFTFKKYLNIDMNFTFPVECKVGKNFAEMDVFAIS